MKSTIKYSLSAALIVIAIKLIIYFSHLQLTPVGVFLSIFSLVLMGIPLALAMKNKRENELNGFLTLKQAMRVGLGISIIAGIIVGLFAYIQFRFIDHDTLPMILEKTITDMHKENAVQSQIDNEIIFKKDFYSPFNQAKGALIGVLGAGFLISFISSTFLIKNPPTTEI